MDRTNASIGFSQHGDTTVSGSAQTHIEGVQLTASSTTNGSTTVGFNYNANNEGPRRGSNVSVNYDTGNGQFSGSLGYTNPDYGIGGTLNLDANGVSLSTQYNGNNVATVTANGFQYDQFNWAQNNINVAQDMTGDAERAKAAEAKASKDRELLIKNGLKPEDFANLPPETQSEVLQGLTIHEENQNLFDSQRDKIDNDPKLSEEQKNAALHQLAYDIENLPPQLRQAALNEMNHVMTVDQMAASTLALLGSSTALFGFLGFSGNGTGQTPTNTNADGPVVARRPEDGDGRNAALRDRSITENETDFGDAKGEGLSDRQSSSSDPIRQSKVEMAITIEVGILNKIESMKNSSLINERSGILQAEAYFSNNAGDRYFKQLDQDSKLTPADKKIIREYYESVVKPISQYGDSNFLGKLKESLPQLRKPVDPLVPRVGTVIIPDINLSDIPAGGRDLTFASGLAIREYNITKDNTDLEARVGIMDNHNAINHDANKIKSISNDAGVGTDISTRYQIPRSGVNASGETLWNSSTHAEDNIHQFTNKPTAETLVTAAEKWKEHLANTNQVHQPLLINDLSMPGAGKSPYLPFKGAKEGHHQVSSAIDVAIPGNGTTYALNYKESISPNYDRNKTRDLIKIMSESVPTGYRFQVYFNDPLLIKEFSSTNIEVSYLDGHDNHLHFQLIQDKSD